MLGPVSWRALGCLGGAGAWEPQGEGRRVKAQAEKPVIHLGARARKRRIWLGEEEEGVERNRK